MIVKICICLLDIEIMEEEEVKKILDEILFKKTKDIEIRRALKMKKHKEALEMADGALKRRIEYEMKNDKLLSSHDEERSLHEAYQFLMREYEARYKMAMVNITNFKHKYDTIFFYLCISFLECF